MNTSKILNGVVLGSALTLVAALPAQAMMIRQTQEMSSSSNVKVEGGSDVKAEASSDSWGRQSQRIVIDDQPTYHMGTGMGGRYRGGHMRSSWARPAANGEVRLSWDMRGGTCHVRYTESTSRGYNYETSANCDDGGITIGGLVSGRNYRFQVRQDDGAWSRPMTVRAW